MIKRLLIVLAVIVLIALTAVLTLPWWWGAVLRGPAEARGITFGVYQRVGYARWALTDVMVRQPGLALRIDRFEAPHPLALWWRAADAGVITVGAWRVVLSPAEPATNEPRGRPPWTDLLDTFDQLTALVPPLEIAAGEVAWADGEAVASVAPSGVDGVGVRLGTVRYERFEAAATFDRRARTIAISSEPFAATVNASLSADGSTWDVNGSWRGHPVTGRVVFADAGGWTPSSAHLDTGAWHVRGEDIGLGGRYATVEARGVLDWIDAGFQFEIRAAGEPLDGVDLPPIQVDLRGSGDESALTIESLTARLPGLAAELDEPFRIARDFERSGAVSRFRLEADLAALPWGNQSGQVKGNFKVSGEADGWPRVEGELRAENLVVGEYRFPTAEVTGEIEWPRWTINEARVKDEAGSVAVIHAVGEGGEVTSSQNRVTLREESVRRWLPDSISFSEASLEGSVYGRWDEPQADVTVLSEQVRVGPLQPVRVEATFTGKELQLVASGGENRNALHASIAREGDGIRIQELVLQQEGAVLLRADAGAGVVYAPEWELQRLLMAGELGSLSVARASLSAGEVAVKAVVADWTWLRAWWADAPALLPRIDVLDMTAAWTPEGVSFAAQSEAVLELPQVGSVAVDLKVKGDRNAVQIGQFEVGKAERRFAAVSGTLPLHWQRGAGGGLVVDEDGPVALQARLLPNPEFWQAWGELTGVALKAPDVELNLSGPWPEISGTGRIALGSLRLSERWGGVDWPLLEGLSASLLGDGDSVRVDRFTARVDGNEVSLNGRLRLEGADLKTLRDEPLSYLRENAEVKVTMVDADLGALARILPDYLVPTGRASVTLDFGRGGQLDGDVRLRGAVTRPLGPLGVLQDINADLSFAGRRVTITQLQGLMGGQPLTLSGAAAWSGGREIDLDLQLRGTNLPLVRKTGMLLRGDLDLTISTADDQTTTVRGKVALHNGLMLADVGSLVPAGGERRSTRPPYFSVEVEPFADWGLDVAVDGENFMRLRTPLLNGVATVHARLDGTLLNPRAIGEVSLREAVVKLPFANFTVEEAVAELSPQNPYEPELHLRAEGKRLGYDLLMELTGTASEPRLELSSEPTLPASDVLLFVMAGVAPKDEVSYSEGRRALQIGLYLGREIVGDLLGLDAGDRLTVTTGEKLSRRGRETYRFGYLLDDRWTLTGEYDEFDYYNAGFKWRWYPWKTEADEATADAEGGEP